MNPPSDREFGELSGEVRGLSRQIQEMREANSREHGEVVRRLEDLRNEVSGKASGERVEKVEARTDSLESTRDEGKGAAWAIKLAQGAIIALLGLLASGKVG